MHAPSWGGVAQLGERVVRNDEVGSSILLLSTTIQKTNHSRLVFFCPFPPVLARVLASLRRTPLPRTAPCRAVFRSLFPPILCFCEGRLRAQARNDAGFRLLVRHGSRLHAGDRARRTVGSYALVDGCNAMTAIPTSAMAAPTKSQRVNAIPSTKYSQTSATAMYMPP